MSQRIHRLPPEVVNRIAAGEIIQRPSAALKELVENSIDAGATRINIVHGQAGLKLLSITDNGSGIAVDDFHILCERFTTSKLREYRDLESICTFGFRGEALASISHVAHLTVTSKTASSKTAFKASFLNGKMSAPPTPCAGLQGTQITIEDLFYNSPMRLNSLKNVNDEVKRCLSVLSQFAIHFHKIAFGSKKQGKSKCDLITTGNSSRQDTIRLIYGQSISKELLPVSAKNEAKLELEGLITNANFNAKSFTLILFINHRLVECSAIKKVVESVYSQLLPKGSYPFAYLHLVVPSHTIDVNVHPTKREVGLLFEAEIVEAVERALQNSLSAHCNSRTYVVRNIAETPELSETSKITQKVLNASQSVRTDFRAPAGRLAAYLSHPEMKTLSSSRAIPADGINSENDDSFCNLTSVRELLDDIRIGCSESLARLFKSYVFVGCIDDTFCLIQSGTKLFVVNATRASKCYFYEQCFSKFSRLRKIYLRSQSGLSIRYLCLIALNDPRSGWSHKDGAKEDIADHIANVFVIQRNMLDEYFAIEVSERGELLALPQLLRSYIPPLALLPMFVLRCGSEINWRDEKECFRGLALEISSLYQIHPGMYLNQAEKEPSLAWVIENVLMPALRCGFHPPKQLLDSGAILQAASCESLYKVFERC